MSEEKDAPPGAISNQNREEQPSQLRDDETHPEPRTRGDDGRADGKSHAGDEGEGAASEDSRATGHPQNAG